jgi:hypothetical protein
MRTQRQGGLLALARQKQTVSAKRQLGTQFITVAALAGICSVVFGVVGTAPHKESGLANRDEFNSPVIGTQTTALRSDPYQSQSAKAETILISEADGPPTLDHHTGSNDKPTPPPTAIEANSELQELSADVSTSARSNQGRGGIETNIASTTGVPRLTNVPMPPRRPKVLSQPTQVAQVVSLFEPARPGPEGNN